MSFHEYCENSVDFRPLNPLLNKTLSLKVYITRLKADVYGTNSVFLLKDYRQSYA